VRKPIIVFNDMLRVSRSSAAARAGAILIFALITILPSCSSDNNHAVREDYVGPAVLQTESPKTGRDENKPEDAETPKSPSDETRTKKAPDNSPLKIDVQQAILLGLENNRTFVVERFNPPIQRTFEQEQRAAFDPLVNGEISQGKMHGLEANSNTFDTTHTTLGALSISEFLPTGTQFGVIGSTDLTDAAPFDSSRVGLIGTQSLARGLGPDVNLAALRQARLDTAISQYELRGFAEALVAQIEETYWDYVLAGRQIDIYTQSLQLAQKQLQEIQQRIDVGKLAQTELAAAQSELALREEGLINARSDLAATRLKMLRQLNPPGDNLWDRSLELTESPGIPKIDLADVEDYIIPAMKYRPDLNQARLGVEKGDLELVKTRNGLLPRLDLFISLGKTGYAQSFGNTIHNPDEKGWDWLVGLRGEWSPMNRAALAQHERAGYTRNQAIESVKNFIDLVQDDVRSAYIEVLRLKEQIAATAVSRKAQEETLRAETEKFRIGRSTSFLVARAQRDLLSSQIIEINALVNYLKSIVELYRLNGSLLQRRGIVAPGDKPVTLKGYPNL
jgi:outer membrane protein